MNWLAHLHLSPPTAADRVGNLLPDLVGGTEQRLAGPRYHAGMALHRAVDRFTDTHPVVRRSLGLFTGRWRLFGGVLTDLFYDHFLSIHWAEFHCADRLEFIAECYADLASELPFMPKTAAEVLVRMEERDWLGSYASMDGMQLTLARVGARLRREVPLEEAIEVLEAQFGPLEADFLEFYPQLAKFVAISTR
jgi:acyl carrier protein phosphodiesterase